VIENGRRLIEDVLPIEIINEHAQREKIGHIASHPRKLHLWWARRPLLAARAAVYSALVPGGRDPDEVREFIASLCRWDAPETALRTAREQIRAAHGGLAPKVLDMFAGGGAIPLEAARLGCEATAIELNPVAYLIEKCMLEYPQRFPGLSNEIRKWGREWVGRARLALEDLYPPAGPGPGQQRILDSRTPLAYLWTRTVRCPNPVLAQHQVPLLRQTWLAKKKGRYVALRAVVDRKDLTVGWEVRESTTEDDLGFDPSAGSSRGQATCPVCGAVVSAEYVKAEGIAGRVAFAPLAAVVLKSSGRGREYLPPGSYPLPSDEECLRRLSELDVLPPEEPLVVGDAKNVWVPLYGLTRFRHLFTPRQLVTLCSLASGVRAIHREMVAAGISADQASAIATYFGLCVDRLADYDSTLCHWDPRNETVMNTYARQALPMVWDFVEPMPFGGAAGDITHYVETMADIAESLAHIPAAVVLRASATALPLSSESQDAVITDPPYYDNISYADLSDFFYVWLKRSVGNLHPDDLGAELTPKRQEAVVAPYRHHGNRDEARAFYEAMMRQSFDEAHRVLKPGAPLVCIYAHKTTLGWSTLVEALRGAGFIVTEAWPLDTEMPQRSTGQGTASLASSIFLVARKRDAKAGSGSEARVLAELDSIIDERLDRLAKAGVTGSDLVIAVVGAGLRAFTRYDRVERENGEPLPAERFLETTQNRVLDAIFGQVGRADPITRFYLAAQFSYGAAAVPFDEANNLARMTGVELDGPHGLTAGSNRLVDKKGSVITLRSFEQRGEDPGLGVSEEETAPRAPLIDVAHGLLWRFEYRQLEIKQYLADAKPDIDLLRNVVQTLAGRGLRSGSRDGKGPEAAAAERLLGSWRHAVEQGML
jgi:putative DNA methylase